MMIRKCHKRMAFIMWAASTIAMSGGTLTYIMNHIDIEFPRKYIFLPLLNTVLMIGITASCEIWY
jgi:hypothetical protein